MGKESLSISSTVVQSVEELLDTLSALPPLVHCRKCRSRLLANERHIFLVWGKGVGPPVTCLHKLRANSIQPRARRRTDTSDSLYGPELNPREKGIS
jgi:hypothetical protein